jgi:hypothetical protein
MPITRRYSKLFRVVNSRTAVALPVPLICGLPAAGMVRMASGFGMDERLHTTGSARKVEA